MTVKSKESNSVHQELLSAAQDIISLVENAGFEITEEGVLRKSDMPMGMKKGEDEEKEMPQEMGEEEQPVEDEMPDMGDIDSNMEEDGESAGEEAMDELDSDEDGELEGDEMLSLLKEMDQDELQELAEMIVSELESRGGSEQDMGDMGDMGGMEAEKSMHKGYDEMQKSFAAFADKVTKSLSDLSKKIEAKPAKKPAKAKMAYGKADVDVLEKSDSAPKSPEKSSSFSKGETIEFLMNRQRAKDPLVKSQLVYEASRINENDENSLKDFHRKLAKSGIQLPKL